MNWACWLWMCEVAFLCVQWSWVFFVQSDLCSTCTGRVSKGQCNLQAGHCNLPRTMQPWSRILQPLQWLEESRRAASKICECIVDMYVGTDLQHEHTLARDVYACSWSPYRGIQPRQSKLLQLTSTAIKNALGGCTRCNLLSLSMPSHFPAQQAHHLDNATYDNHKLKY